MPRLLLASSVLLLSLGAGRLAVAGPICASENGNNNADGGIDLSDALYILTHLFQGGDPPEPGPPTYANRSTSVVLGGEPGPSSE